MRSSSWPALVLLVRPFSNTLETICVSIILLVLASQTRQSELQLNENTTNTGIGILLFAGFLCSIGIFTRFTFGIFAVPAVLAILHRRGCDALTTRRTTLTSDDDSVVALPSGTSAVASRYLTAVLGAAIWIGIAFLIGVRALVSVDSHFYHSRKDSSDRTRYVLTPWNALVYNSRVGNLSDHGLHPRITHYLVNMPMLYGPLAILLYASTVRDIWDRLMYHTIGKRDTVPLSDRTSQVLPPIFYPVCRGIVWMGLGVLSCAPHQEARFLLPLVVPLSLLHGRTILHARQRRTMILFWILFNLILMIFFGGLHQGGVTSSLVALPENHVVSTTATRSSSTLKALISYHTYMPPTFLLREGIRTSFGVKDKVLSNNMELDTCLLDSDSCDALKTSSELEQTK